MNDRGGATATRLVAVALGALFAGFAALYGWQAWHHGTPWLFSDELKLTLLSRAIAETGHAAWRGEPHSFETLYTYLTAPAWWTDDTKTAYTVVKAIGVAAMASVIFPSYALARMVASRPASLFAAAAAGAIPALAYSSLIIEEPLAYPYSALALFLTVKALVTRSRWWIGGAVAVALVGPWIRGQLSLLTAILGLATVLFVATGPWARKRLRTWSTWDRVGAGVLLCGALILLNELLAKHSDAWNVSTRIAKGRIFDLGLQAGSALTIGLGVLPVVVGLALMLSFGENASPARRAFACTFWAALCAFTTYTAIKAAYLSTVFATRVEERNLIYVAPLLFAATAIWLDRPRLRLVPAGAALLFVLFLIVRKPYQLDYPYFEAPGTGIVVLANREFNWSNDYERTILLWVLGFVALVGLLPTALSAARRSVSETWAAAARGMLVALAVVLIAWNLTGEIYTARGFNDLSSRFVRNLPKPLDWVDEATGGKPVVYLGQRIQDPNGVWLTEFWNRSIKKVWSTDGTAPGPAPVLTLSLIHI